MTTDHTQISTTSDLGVNPSLVRYGSIFLLVVGTFGNILSFIIFSQSSLRKSSTFRYLALLSLMDLLVLYSGLLDLFLTVEYDGLFSLRTLNPITCRLHTFITYWSQHSSSWILSLISVDRAIATNCIQYARKFCTPRSAEYVVGIILILIALLNSHELIFLHLQSSDGIELTKTIDNTTLLNSFNSKENLFSTSDSQVQFDDDRQQQRRNIEAAFLLLSICDSPQWNFLCPREKRDLSSSTLGNNLLYSLMPIRTANFSKNFHESSPSPIASIPSRSCAALQDSVYEYFWDNVWEWVDVCCYALVPFTVMSVGTFLIVYRVYYQHRRLFRSRRSGQTNPSSTNSQNKAKSLFYLLFTLNLLYFILVSPVVFATSILFRDRQAEISYPRFKAIIYLMQYCNHSLNFIFYGITSPPYRQTLCQWSEILMTRLPNCCRRTIRRQSKSSQNRSTTLTNLKPKQIRVSMQKRKDFSANGETIIELNSEPKLDANQKNVSIF